MRLLLDTDVLLDVALHRPEFFEESAALMACLPREALRRVRDEA